jgi:hypothetical protein
MNQKIQIAKVYHECKTTAMNSINFCFHPECNEDSINSHILQKNGILSSIAEDGHVVEMQINKFKEEVHNFKKIGLNNAFSFNCFCSKHDRELFKSIELVEIDFTNYKNLLLFTLRTIYNEKFRKLVNLKMYEGLILNPHLFDIDYFLGAKKQEELGLNDIEKTEKTIWEDFNNGEQSYIFKVREIEKKEICLSAFYNYDTSQELSNYIFENRKDKEEVTDIFVNLFPYKNKSIFMMAYKSKNKEQVKNYVNEFFNGNEKRLERKITNLMMFQCETWVVSNKFYLKNIAKTQNAFSFAVNFSHRNMNERKFFDLNIFRDDFSNKFKVFQKNAENYLHLNGS